MRIQPQQFIARFVSRSSGSEALAEPCLTQGDRVELTPSSLSPRAAFQQKVLALAAATAGGPPALAALSQSIARSLTSSEQEEQFAASLNDVFRRQSLQPAPTR